MHLLALINYGSHIVQMHQREIYSHQAHNCLKAIDMQLDGFLEIP